MSGTARRVVVAPDSFKGSLSAVDAARAMERGVLAAWPDAEVEKVPIADGGEGTVEAMVMATGGRFEHRTVRGPLGEPVPARWGVLGDGATAVIEMAAASGLPLVPPGRRDPRVTSTFGTGELVLAALEAGFRRLVLGIGGSATNDGGTGLARALGVRFLDEAGRALPEGGASLSALARIDLSGLDPRIAAAEVLVACDVDNPLTGPRGASAIYGPQKGATAAMVAELDAALARLAEVATRTTGRDVAGQPGAGAAGGLGAGLLFFTPARLVPGVDLVLDAARFDARVRGAHLVLTGEGRTDAQTAMGKAPVGVARVARRHGVPVHLVSGSLGPGADAVHAHGIDRIAAAAPPGMPVEEAMARASELLEAAVHRSLRG
ncbi:MAG TPA: glycerate kinase [Anaeromyxobacteraceae bacterium]|nr:glycerate kinase [Anaeromyxobacteraceae bacterium]